MLNLSIFLLGSMLLSSSAFSKIELVSTGNTFQKEGRKKDYQIGDEWGKKKVTRDTLKNESPVFVRAAKATAKLPIGGTGFYIGKFAGKHILATNYHVCENAKACVGDKAKFALLNKSFKMKRLLISLPDVDMALLEIDVPAKDEAVLANVAQNFSFDKELYKGQELLTIGFGIGNNPRMSMMANQDSDCKVFSEDGDYKHMVDPDRMNPGDYRAWSFSHACEISHGDSGSAMVDRSTGEVVGIVWTGRLPKSSFVQKSANLDIIFNESSSEVWDELSYAVPASKVGEYLRKHADLVSTPTDVRDIFNAILN